MGGVLVVSIVEFLVGFLCLRGRKRARSLFAGHVLSMLLGFFFLSRSLFANWLDIHYRIASISNSVNIGLFGLFWMVSAAFVVAAIRDLAKRP